MTRRIAILWILLLAGSLRAQLVEKPEIKAIHAEANRLRAQSGKPAHVLDEKLCKVAQDWADHMAATGNFSHGGGEQIIAWYGSPKAPATVCFDLWMPSPGHKAWVLSSTSKCGYGIARTKYATYWAGAFASQPVQPPNPGTGGGRPVWIIIRRIFGW